MSKRLLNLCAGTLLLCGIATDAQGWDFSRSGLYMGVGGSFAMDMAAEDELKDILDALGLVSDVDMRDSFGLPGRLGWRFIPHFAAEVQIEYLFGFEAKILGQRLGEFEMLTATLNAKLPLTTRDVQPFVLVGVGALNANFEDTAAADLAGDDWGPALRGGGGLDLYITERVVVSVDATYVRPFANVADLDYLSVGFGVQYRF